MLGLDGGPGIREPNSIDCWGTASDEEDACTEAIIFVGEGKGDPGRRVAEVFLWRSGCLDGRDGAKYTCKPSRHKASLAKDTHT